MKNISVLSVCSGARRITNARASRPSVSRYLVYALARAAQQAELPQAPDDPLRALAAVLFVAQAAARDEFGDLDEDCIGDPRYSIRRDHGHCFIFLFFF
jgi:hypothetical protein